MPKRNPLADFTEAELKWLIKQISEYSYTKVQAAYRMAQRVVDLEYELKRREREDTKVKFAPALIEELRARTSLDYGVDNVEMGDGTKDG